MRNKEIRRFLLSYSLVATLAVLSGLITSRRTGILVLLVSAAFALLFWRFARERYQKIERLSEQIDLVLHNAEHLIIADSEEGELSILQSEIIKMTQRIREQNRALRREKEHLADSLADIAHQFRTPLTSANLILTLLEASPAEKEQKELLRETKELYGQMEWLITSLLKLSRLDAGVVEFQTQRIEMGRLINAAAQPLLLSMELRGITLETDILEGIWIQGDFQWLSEAIRNILKNCMENMGELPASNYEPETSQVTDDPNSEAGMNHLPNNHGSISITCRDNPLFTSLTIHDSGPGIPPEDLPFLFDRFYRGKNSDAAGYGIGLALCRTIIMRQNGTISAKNHPAGGAVFTIRFSK